MIVAIAQWLTSTRPGWGFMSALATLMVTGALIVGYRHDLAVTRAALSAANAQVSIVTADRDQLKAAIEAQSKAVDEARRVALDAENSAKRAAGAALESTRQKQRKDAQLNGTPDEMNQWISDVFSAP